jgi:transposase InsO family protein
VIVLAVRWYQCFGLSYRDVEELLTERGVEVDHVTVYRWVLRFPPLLAEAARPCRHAVGSRWQVDETYVKVAGRWRYVYRAIDQFDQAISATKVTPVEVTTDQAPVYPAVLEDLLPAAWHPLRAGGGGASEPASSRGGRRTGFGDLIPEEAMASARPASGQRNSAVWRSGLLTADATAPRPWVTSADVGSLAD